MKRFHIKYNANENIDFIDEMLRYSNANDNVGIGYPRYDTVKEFINEIESYDSTLEDSIGIIYYEDIPIGIVGILYEEGSESGYFVGPIVIKEYFNEENVKNIIKLILERKNCNIKILRAAPLNSNKILRNAYEDNEWIYDGDHRVMVCYLDNKERQVKYNIKMMENEELTYNESIFNILNSTFNWNGSKEEYDDLLRDDYFTSCVLDRDKKVMGLVVWSLMEDEQCCVLEYLVVDENYRNKGIGKALVNYVINNAIKNNRTSVELCTQINNKAAELYRKIGFEDTLVMNLYKRFNN
ncbi:GNAT family N-acetyltransferase [Clostridium ihumii]|uniref:GNAT family N-acetyltransferase n=1 Tax=Clostridium ihumii TaxID=1470356 RepID=UPI00058D8200|nr:GNAT family N-acetyltransferase [Clostridium ihumii]